MWDSFILNLIKGQKLLLCVKREDINKDSNRRYYSQPIHYCNFIAFERRQHISNVENFKYKKFILTNFSWIGGYCINELDYLLARLTEQFCDESLWHLSQSMEWVPHQTIPFRKLFLLTIFVSRWIHFSNSLGQSLKKSKNNKKVHWTIFRMASDDGHPFDLFWYKTRLLESSRHRLLKLPNKIEVHRFWNRQRIYIY